MTGLDGLVTRPENPGTMEEGPEFPDPPPEIPVPGEWTLLHLPPPMLPERAAGFYRFLLWLLPGCVAVTTLVGFDLLGRSWRAPVEPLTVVWFLVNVPSTIAAGIFVVKLEPVRWDGLAPRFEVTGVIKFVLLQVLIIPALTVFALIAGALFGAI